MSAPREDYYAVLQVQPDAEPEVIEAAYRQLMRKYHPDIAGADLEGAAMLHERAKTINRAYAVLRDSKQRWIYDRLPNRRAASTSPPGPPPGGAAEDTHTSARPGPHHTWRPAASSVTTRTETTTVAANATPRAAHLGALARLLSGISTLYYFLPGPYEWERGSDKDLLSTLLVPVLGVASWSLASGRLNWLTGQGPYYGLFAWAILVMLAIPLWPILARLLLAGLPTVLLLTGPGQVLLQMSGLPPLLAWSGAGVLGVMLSARLYLFTVLPTVVICWTFANASLGQTGLWSALTQVDASVPTGQLGLLTIACLLGILSWLTVMDWRRTANPTTPSASAQPKTAPPASNQPMFQRMSADRVRTLQAVPLRTDRDRQESPSVILAAKQEANVVLVREQWAFLQTDDGREGWAEWRIPA